MFNLGAKLLVPSCAVLFWFPYRGQGTPMLRNLLIPDQHATLRVKNKSNSPLIKLHLNPLDLYLDPHQLLKLKDFRTYPKFREVMPPLLSLSCDFITYTEGKPWHELNTLRHHRGKIYGCSYSWNQSKHLSSSRQRNQSKRFIFCYSVQTWLPPKCPALTNWASVSR